MVMNMLWGNVLIAGNLLILLPLRVEYTVEIVDFLPAIEVSGAEVNIESLLRANLLTAFLRQGVRM